jgi:hypothetical protein
LKKLHVFIDKPPGFECQADRRGRRAPPPVDPAEPACAELCLANYFCVMLKKPFS